jgi:hypothetical protein
MSKSINSMNKIFLFSTVLHLNACTKDSEDTTTSSEAVVINVKSSNFKRWIIRAHYNSNLYHQTENG